MPEYKGWKYRAVVNKEDDRVVSYGIAFWRKTNAWYDEIRYDSHDIRRGVAAMRPHLHVKLQSSFKEPLRAIDEIKDIIDTHLPQLRELLMR